MLSAPAQQQPAVCSRRANSATHAAPLGRRHGHACQAAPVAAFEPHVDSQALTAQLVVLSATAATAAYWWLSVVPSARRTLAKEKRAGPLNSYLTDLQSNPERRVERWFYTDWLQQLSRRQQLSAAAAAKRAAAAAQQASSITTAAAADMLPQATVQQQQQQSAGQPEQQYASQPAPVDSSSQQPGPALPGVGGDEDDTMPSFWSLDNPILATALLLAGITLISSVLHQQ